MSYMNEFPNYDSQLYLPNGWTDSSFKGDPCPSVSKVYRNGGTEVEFVIWQDYVDKSKREYDWQMRFMFQINVDNVNVFRFETDDINEIKKIVFMVTV